MKIAVIQSEWIKDPSEALEMAYHAVRDATQQGLVDIVCFPEFFLGPPWYMPGQNHLKGVTDTVIPGPVTDGFADMARALGVYILLGSVVEDLQDGTYQNSSLLINPYGEFIANAIKAHAFGNEMVLCRQADTLTPFDTPIGRIGVAVCSDFWIPEVVRLFAVSGARVVFVPGGTLHQNQNLMVNALSTTAYLNGVYLVYASSVGVVRGFRGDRQVEVHFAGTSLVADPNGSVIARAGTDSAEILLVDINPSVDLDCDAGLWLSQRRPAAYRDLLGGYVGAYRNLGAELESNLAESVFAASPRGIVPEQESV